MSKRIILTGGGTGGHITPLLAVAHEIKLQDPSCHIVYIGERNGKFSHLTKENTDIDESHYIFAGKFRRYHKESWLKRITAIETNILNLRDAIYFMIGTLQSVILLSRLKPNIMLLKGGFVGVPMGLAAAVLKVPFVTHDSDAIPGLANRIVSKWALYHATGMPVDFYSYPKRSSRYVGVLVGSQYGLVTSAEKKLFKNQLNIPDSAQVLVITGGSLGAFVINKSVRSFVAELLLACPNLYIIHQVGKGHVGIYNDLTHERLQVHELLSPMHVYTGAADIVVTRAGANTMAELGTQGKACIVVPNPLLTGGHQLKNAALWSENQAALIMDEERLRNDPKVLLRAIMDLLANDSRRNLLAANLESLTAKNATQKLVKLLLESKLNENSKK